MKRAIIAIVCLVALAACSEEAQDALETLEEQPATVRIEARRNVCWSGSIGNSTKEGCGSKSFPIEGEAIVVANAQKEGEKGELTVILEVDGEEVDRGSTTAAFGVVQVSE